jgi:uncharacterized membrane protein YphA (DoxX/SURF4 family)
MRRPPAAVELLLLRAALAFVWLATGLGVFSPEYRRLGEEYLGPTGLPPWVMPATCAGEVLLGLWVLSGRAGAWAAAVQTILILGFTAILSVTQPGLWAHPFGVLAKNLPLLALIGVVRLLETEGWTARATWLLRAGMAILWLTEGLFACVLFQGEEIRRVAASTGLAYPDPATFLYVGGVLQILSAAAALLLRGRPLRLLLAAQLLGLAGVCVVVTRYDPALWLHPFGPLTKNVPVLIGTAVLLGRFLRRPTVDTGPARPDNRPGVPVGH